jgi:hypothetical protein
MLRHWLGAAASVIFVLTACTDREASDATLGPLSSPGSSTTQVVTAPPATPEAAATTAADAPPGAVGAGFVSIRVRLASSGVDESLSLDRSSVATEDLDPISLDAFCTALDDGDGWTVSVTDLRRLSAGGMRLVSAVLRIDATVTEPGVYEGTLEVGDTAQQVTAYDGPITVDAGLASGSFDLRDASGRAATGAFVCAPEPVPTTTVPAPTVAGSVPVESQPPAAGPTAPPPPTVPAATS